MRHSYVKDTSGFVEGSKERHLSVFSKTREKVSDTFLVIVTFKKFLNRKVLEPWMTKILCETSKNQVILVTSGSDTVSPPSPLDYTGWFHPV
jgi:hypothetical protein